MRWFAKRRRWIDGDAERVKAPQNCCVETACRRYRRDYAELPSAMDVPHGRACFGGGLRDRQTRIAHVWVRGVLASLFTKRAYRMICCSLSWCFEWLWICYEPDYPQNQLHLLDRSRRKILCRQRGDIKNSVWSRAATRRLSCLTMPIWQSCRRAASKFGQRSDLRLHQTAFAAQSAIYDEFCRKLVKRVALNWATAWGWCGTSGSLIDRKSGGESRQHIADALTVLPDFMANVRVKNVFRTDCFKRQTRRVREEPSGCCVRIPFWNRSRGHRGCEQYGILIIAYLHNRRHRPPSCVGEAFLEYGMV